MSTATPTFGQLKAQVAAIRQKVPQARVIGIRAAGRWTAEPHKQDGEYAYLIQQCDSPLAMRLALREPTDENTTKILVTPQGQRALLGKLGWRGKAICERIFRVAVSSTRTRKDSPC